MTIKLIVAFLTSLAARIATFFGAYWLGRTAGKNAAFKREVDQGREDVKRATEAQRAEETVRALGDDVLNERLSKFSRKPKPKP